MPLFKNKICGNKYELEKQYNIKVINYILNNDNFEYYIKSLNGTKESKFYIVYENKQCVERKLVKNTVINLTKKR